MKRCVGLTPALTQRICVWFAFQLQWNFVQTKTALQQCFGARTISDPRIYFWRRQFWNGRAQIVDLHRQHKHKSGRSRANIRLVESAVAQYRRVTIPQLMLQTGLKHTTVQRILTLDLQLSKKCAKYNPYHITDEQYQRRQRICDFWSRLRARAPAVFRVAVTMDESWAYCYDPETKEQSRKWLRRNEVRPQKPTRNIGTRKVMVVTFFDSVGLIYREFVRPPQTINQLYFRQIVTRFDIACQNRRPRGMVGGRRFIHMDNAPAHTAALTRQHLQNLGWTILPHPPYSPDLAPNDFWLYPRMKKGLRGQRFPTLGALEDAVDDQFALITAQEYHQCMLVKWPSRWRKCLAQQGCYFEGIA